MNLTDNAEFVDQAFPDGDGGIAVMAVGNGSCRSAQAFRITQNGFFRCCL